MSHPTEKQAASEIAALLGELFSTTRRVPKVRQVAPPEQFDFAVSVAGHRFIAEYKRQASAGSIAAAIDRFNRSTAVLVGRGFPLIVVPFMGAVGRQLCEQAGIAWLDLCGNARIVVPGLRVWIEGRPNKFSERGRPPNVFAPKSSRIARQLLLHSQQFQTQAALARQTGLGDGYVSKIVRRLEQENYIKADEQRAVRPCNSNVLLDAWRDAYDFKHHRIIKGHVPARSGEQLLHRVVDELRRERVEWAMTGLSAAWLYTRFAAFRLVTVYLPSIPSPSLLQAMEFSDEPKGANLWMVLPDDDGVFQGSQTQDGIPCVSPLQTYLDLKGQPERAIDAAAELRRSFLN